MRGAGAGYSHYRVRRRAAYGIFEGARGNGWGSAATKEGLWGNGLEASADSDDAELAAIHALLRKIVAKAGRNAKQKKRN